MLPNYNPHDFHFLAFAPFFLAFVGIFVLITIIPYWFIFKKAGFSPWLCVLMFMPMVNLIVLYVVAFSQWKVVPVPYGYPVQPPPPPAYYPPQG